MVQSRESQQFRFQLGQHVEVLQRSRDLRGSWQPATIVMAKDGRREVEYSELFQSDGVRKLRESYSVMWDTKNSCRDWRQKFGLNVQGFLRPVPPQLTSRDLKSWSKGLLVDAFSKGAWWEGVLSEDIDNADDETACVKVFFPDRDYESAVDVKNLRVSHEWDDITGNWELRGQWKGFSPSGQGKHTSWKETHSSYAYSPKPANTPAHNSQVAHAKSPKSYASSAHNSGQKLFVTKKRIAVKNFLLDAGYKVEFHQRIGRGREAVYISPAGRRFYSLTMACKAWKRDHNMSSNTGPCESKEAKLLSIYDIFEGSPCLEPLCSEKKETIEGKHGGNFVDKDAKDSHIMQSVDTTECPPCIEPPCSEKERTSKVKRCRKSLLDKDSHVTKGEDTTCSGKRETSKRNRSRKPVVVEGSIITQGSPCTELPGGSRQKRRPLKGNNSQKLPCCESAWDCHSTTSSITERTDSHFRIMVSPLIDRSNGKQGLEAFNGGLKSPSDDDVRDSYSPASTITEAMKPLLFSPMALSSTDRETNMQVEKKVEVDDICSACGDGGELVLCDHCPSTYHAKCAGLEAVPEGNWYCFGCCCASCEAFLFEREDGTTPFSCNQCEKKYHISCSPLEGRHRKYNAAESHWFCSENCEEIYAGLHRLIGIPHPLEIRGFSWMLLRFTQQESLHSRVMAASNSKLSVAHAVLQECFVPMIDKCTGLDIIAQVLFSQRSQMIRLNCGGFYTLILERGCELVSVATIRIHGSRLAEVPFIGTRFHHRRKGMCRRLMCVLEKMLEEVGVKKLILPAVPQLLKTWRGKFGFQHINSTDRREMMSMNLMRFPGTTLLKKYITKLGLKPQICCRSMLSNDRHVNTQVQIDKPEDSGSPCTICVKEKSEGNCLLSKDASMGSDSERSKRSRRTMMDFDSDDAKVITARTKFKRLVRSSQWYVDSMKELSNDAVMSRNKRRLRICTPSIRKRKKSMASRSNRWRRGLEDTRHVEDGTKATNQSMERSTRSDTYVAGKMAVINGLHDPMDGVQADDCDLLTFKLVHAEISSTSSVLLEVQEVPTGFKVYTRRRNHHLGPTGISCTGQISTAQEADDQVQNR